MTDPRDLERLEREEWFVEMRRAYREGIVEGMDGATYQHRGVLPRDVNLHWVRSRLNSAKVESASPGWILGILEEQYPLEGEPVPLDSKHVLNLIKDTWG